VRLRRTGWENEDERERFARSIKRSLFCNSSSANQFQVPETHEASEEKEIMSAEL
jgi:hypothetical protein